MRPKKVLLCVNDNEQELSVLKFMLSTTGYRVVSAATGQEAIDEIIKVQEEDSGPISKEVNQLDGIPIGVSSGAAVWAALQVAKRPENAGKTIVAIVPSSSERYLSTCLFADINVESDDISSWTTAV